MQTHLQTQSVSQNEPSTQAKTINDFSANNNTLQRHAALTDSVIQCRLGEYVGHDYGWHIHNVSKTHMKFKNDDFARADFYKGVTWAGVERELVGKYQDHMGNTQNPITVETLKNKDAEGWNICHDKFKKVLKLYGY